MEKKNITNKLTKCCRLPFSVAYWWVENLTLNSDADREFVRNNLRHDGTLSIDAWRVLINSGTLESDASLTRSEFLAWFDCGRQPSCEQFRLIIEGYKVSNYNPSDEYGVGWTAITNFEVFEDKIIKKITDFVGGVGVMPTELSDLIGKYYAVDGGFTLDKNLATDFTGNSEITQNITQNITNQIVDPSQIVPSEALYNDENETVAINIEKRIDFNDGYDVNYSVDATWYDGTAITDAKLDGDIFVKVDGVFKRKMIDKKALLKINTIADLRLQNGYYVGQEITLMGYYVSGDKEPLNYIWKLGQGVDDGGGIINSSKGRWEAQFNGKKSIRDYGAKGDSISDDTAFINKAIANQSLNDIIIVPNGIYNISGNLNSTGSIRLLGLGAGSKLPIFDLKSDITNGLININSGLGGNVEIDSISFNMNFKNGNAIQVNSDLGYINVRNCVIKNVALNYWGFECNTPSPINGLFLSNIDNNRFIDFKGGGIKVDKGGDSCNISRNVFALIDSKSHILLWTGLTGTACLNFTENNATGAEKFIEINGVMAAKITKNQFEATTPLTNTYKSMINIGVSTTAPTCTAFDVSNNNMNGHNGNAEVGVFINNAVTGNIINNDLSGVIYDVYGIDNYRAVKYQKGEKSTGTIFDPRRSITVENLNSNQFSEYVSDLFFKKQQTKLKFGDNLASSILDFDSANTSFPSVIRLGRNTDASIISSLQMFKGSNITHNITNSGSIFLNTAGGVMGIGKPSSSAILALKGGTTTVPSFIIDGGVLTTTPITGAIESDFNNIYHTNSHGRFKLQYKPTTPVTTVVTPDATDLTTALALVNELKAKLNEKLNSDNNAGN